MILNERVFIYLVKIIFIDFSQLIITGVFTHAKLTFKNVLNNHLIYIKFFAFNFLLLRVKRAEESRELTFLHTYIIS